MNDSHVGNQERENLWIFNMLGTKNPKRLMNDSHVGNQERENLLIFNMLGTKNLLRWRNDLHAGNQEHVKIYEWITCWEPRRLT